MFRSSAPPAPRRSHRGAPDVDPTDEYVARVEERMTRLFAEERDQWSCRYPAIAVGLETVESFVLRGGKRLRPRFLYWGFAAGGGDPRDARLVEVGAAIELFHAFALIHDDIMDASDTRRHQPTVHRRFAALHEQLAWRGERRRVAEAFAILLGDLAFAYSNRLLVGVPAPVAAVFDTMRIELHVGQYLDLHCAATERPDTRTVQDVAAFKTAKYSVERPLHLGTTLASSPHLDPFCSAYGLAVGEAFQHRDDLLGVFGDRSVTGKPTGDDLRAGKTTMLLQRTRQATGAGSIDALARVGTEELGDADIADIAAFMQRCGAVDAVERRIRELIEQAQRTVDRAPLPAAVRGGLADMACRAGWRTW
jgi:geranylgeranyl diphosphate synthase type I